MNDISPPYGTSAWQGLLINRQYGGGFHVDVSYVSGHWCLTFSGTYLSPTTICDNDSRWVRGTLTSVNNIPTGHITIYDPINSPYNASGTYFFGDMLGIYAGQITITSIPYCGNIAPMYYAPTNQWSNTGYYNYPINAYPSGVRWHYGPYMSSDSYDITWNTNGTWTVSWGIGNGTCYGTETFPANTFNYSTGHLIGTATLTNITCGGTIPGCTTPSSITITISYP